MFRHRHKYLDLILTPGSKLDVTTEVSAVIMHLELWMYKSCPPQSIFILPHWTRYTIYHRGITGFVWCPYFMVVLSNFPSCPPSGLHPQQVPWAGRCVYSATNSAWGV